MKSLHLNILTPFFMLAIFSLASCKKDKCVQTVTYKTYEPVYMTYEALRSAVRSEDARPLLHPGKIYLRGNYIFVSEINQGIHVIDNSNPSAPQNIAFINIPGNHDLAANGNTLYADSYIDLLALDISNPRQVSISQRVQDALPYQQYTNGYYADPQKGVVSEWKEVVKTEKVNTDCQGGGTYYGKSPWVFEGDVITLANAGGVATPTTSSTSGAPGIGGSTARFTLANGALYIVDNSNLKVYDITSNNLQKVADKSIGWSIETIFPYKNHLFIGSSAGVYIYDISSPFNPSYMSQYNHITACDPVVVDDNYAYFTLSNDAPCHMGVNQLEVVDITNLANPTLKVTVPMTNPKGLGMDNGTLFICDSNDGLKVYDATDIMTIAQHQVAHFSNINAFDVIPYNNHLLMVGDDGLYQYDYSNLQQISLLSRIPVQK